MSDEELMQQVQRGHMASFEMLVDKWFTPMMRYANAFLADNGQSEDAVMDCFATLYHKRAAYDTALPFERYLKALVRYKCIDMLRKNKRVPVPVEYLADKPSRCSPESLLIDKVFRKSLLRAVEELDDDDQALLCAYAQEGKSYRDLARMFRKTVPQIKMQLHRIRKKLKKVKEEWL